MFKKEILTTSLQILPTSIVKVTETNNSVEVKWTARENSEPTVKKISNDLFVNVNTGEVIDVKHKRERSTNNVNRTAENLRNLISCNVTPQNSVLVTLTYENAADDEQMKLDRDAFRKALKRHYGDIRYIIVPELQERGTWHYHYVLIFPEDAPYIEPDKLQKLWNHGDIHIGRIFDTDGLGRYLTKEMRVTAKNLKLYPSNMRLYTPSHGLMKPEVFYMLKCDAEDYTKDLQIKEQQAIRYTDEDSGFQNLVSRTVYQKCQN